LAVQSEFLQLRKLKVFEVVDELSKGRKAIDSRIVFREKYDEHGNLIKFKACIVAKGFSQVPGKDFTKTFSSVAKFLMLRTFFSYMAYLDWKLHHINVVTAYLHGPLDKEIYMTIPESVKGFNSGHYWKLEKVLYGLKQAGRQWKKCLHKALTFFGFSQAVTDDCLYVKQHEGKITLIVLVYIDDMAIASPNRLQIISLKSFLKKDFEISNLDELQHMLGVLVTHDHPNRLFYLNQTTYIL